MIWDIALEFQFQGKGPDHATIRHLQSTWYKGEPEPPKTTNKCDTKLFRKTGKTRLIKMEIETDGICQV